MRKKKCFEFSLSSVDNYGNPEGLSCTPFLELKELEVEKTKRVFIEIKMEYKDQIQEFFVKRNPSDTLLVTTNSNGTIKTFENCYGQSISSPKELSEFKTRKRNTFVLSVDVDI